jgi:hypothetical protein
LNLDSVSYGTGIAVGRNEERVWIAIEAIEVDGTSTRDVLLDVDDGPGACPVREHEEGASVNGGRASLEAEVAGGDVRPVGAVGGRDVDEKGIVGGADLVAWIVQKGK